MQSILTGYTVEVIPSSEGTHMRYDLDKLVGIEFIIHTTALKDGEPYFWAHEQRRPIAKGQEKLLNIDGHVSNIGVLYRLRNW